MLEPNAGLRGCEPRCEDPIGRGRHVIEANPLAQVDRGTVAGMLTANPDLEPWRGRSAGLNRHRHKPADSLLVDGDERIGAKDPALMIDPKEAVRIVAA